MYRTGKTIGTEGKFVVARGRDNREMRSDCLLMGVRVPFEVMNMFCNSIVVKCDTIL